MQRPTAQLPFPTFDPTGIAARFEDVIVQKEPAAAVYAEPVFKGGPALIDAQPLDRRFERLAGSTEFRGRSRSPELRAWLPARAAAIIDGVEDMAAVQKSDINPEDVPFCWAALSRNSNEIG